MAACRSHMLMRVLVLRPIQQLHWLFGCHCDAHRHSNQVSRKQHSIRRTLVPALVCWPTCKTDAAAWRLFTPRAGVCAGAAACPAPAPAGPSPHQAAAACSACGAPAPSRYRRVDTSQEGARGLHISKGTNTTPRTRQHRQRGISVSGASCMSCVLCTQLQVQLHAASAHSICYNGHMPC
jgi:hypothetical protein